MEQVMTENGSLWEKNRVWLLAAFLGMITFICIYGIRILDFTYDDWLLNGGGSVSALSGLVFFQKQ